MLYHVCKAPTTKLILLIYASTNVLIAEQAKGEKEAKKKEKGGAATAPAAETSQEGETYKYAHISPNIYIYLHVCLKPILFANDFFVLYLCVPLRCFSMKVRGN